MVFWGFISFKLLFCYVLFYTIRNSNKYCRIFNENCIRI